MQNEENKHILCTRINLSWEICYLNMVYANVKHNNNNMDLKIRMIGVYIYQLQYFLMEIDVDKQQ